MNLCDTNTVKNIMTAYGLHFRKEFGQNFLTNKMVVEDIADNCCDDASSTILEIGPGIGSLTRELVGNGEITFSDSEKTTYFSRAYYKSLRDRIEEIRFS